MKYKKMLAILAVAAFCVSAFVIAVDTEDSSAVDDGLTYSFYLQLNNGTDTFSARLPDVTVAGTEPSGDTYKAALTAAATAAGNVTVSWSGNMITGFTAETKEYNQSAYGDWGTDHYFDTIVYYDDAGTWKTANLDESTQYVIVFDKYAFSEPSDPSKYTFIDWGPGYQFWAVSPTVQVVEYKIFFDLTDNDGARFTKWVTSSQLGISGNSLKSARVLGAKAAGFTVVNGKGSTTLTSVTADDHTYAKHGTYGGDDYWGYAAYYGTSDNEWKDLQAVDVDSVTTVAHVFNLYKMQDPNDDTYYHHEAGVMDEYWTKLPCELPDGSSGDDKKDNNIFLFVGIGVGVVAVVAIAAVFIIKRP